MDIITSAGAGTVASVVKVCEVISIEGYERFGGRIKGNDFC